MNYRTERCAVGDNVVTLVTDFEGTVTSVICPDYDYANGVCARRRLGNDSGALTNFLERVSPHTAPDELNRCLYLPA